MAEHFNDVNRPETQLEVKTRLSKQWTKEYGIDFTPELLDKYGIETFATGTVQTPKARVFLTLIAEIEKLKAARIKEEEPTNVEAPTDN